MYTMHFVLQTPSLQHLAGVKIVASLWSQRHVFVQIEQTFTGRSSYELREDGGKWLVVEENVRSKVWALPLPETCQKELSHFVKPLGLEIIDWCHYHNLEDDIFHFLENRFPQQLCWTMHGTADYAKTARLMVKDESLSVKGRYVIACLNCLEDEARQLIKLIPKGVMARGAMRVEHQRLLTYFTCTLDRGNTRYLNRYFKPMLPPGDSVNKVLFQDALSYGDGVTCEYWFKKLSPGERERVLDDRETHLSSCSTESRAFGFLYYVSLMNEERRGSMFREGSSDLLVCLLRWPLQSLFVEAMKCGSLRFMRKAYYAEVLNAIADLISRGFEHYDYSQLFWEVWRSSPAEYKQFVLGDFFILRGLLRTKREEFMKFILSEVSLSLLTVCYDEICEVLSDENVISEAALMEFQETAALMSSEDPENEEKRLRSENVNRLVIERRAFINNYN